MRKISAPYIFPVSQPVVENGIIYLDDEGVIQGIERNNFSHGSDVEYFDGIITPGFINAHCHLELSGMSGQIEEGRHLHHFIDRLMILRRNQRDAAVNAIEHADRMMAANGIVAVADIANTSDAIAVKNRSNIFYHTFFEIMGTDDSKAADLFSHAIEEVSSYSNISVTVHAPYSCSKALITIVSQYCDKQGFPLSIHNQESDGENALFINGSGPIADMLKKLNTRPGVWIPSGQSSLLTVLPLLPAQSVTLLVHNTFSSPADVINVIQSAKNVCWVLAPNANLYIEKCLPDIYLLDEMKQPIALGTDSMGSNKTLSILEEMKTLQHYFKRLSLSRLIKWATLNGARALNMDKWLGSIDPGKAPGLNLIINADLQHLMLTSGSAVKVLVPARKIKI